MSRNSKEQNNEIMVSDISISESVEERLSAGDAALRVGDLAAGGKHYNTILETDPSNEAALAGIEFVEYLEGGRKSRYHIPIERIPAEVWREREGNRQKNLAEFEEGKTRLDTHPPTCYIEHTTKCNFYCPHCSKGYEPYLAADLSGDLIDKFLHELKPLPQRIIITGFGEPTIGSEYIPLMRKIIERGATPSFNTNASTLNVGHIDMLVHSQSQVTLSIDGASKETFETIRAGGDWDRLQKVLHSVKRIRSVYQPAGWWGITFVAVRMNIHELPEMVRLAKRFGFDEVLVHDYLPVGKEFDEQSLRNEPERANSFFDEAENLAEELNVPLKLPPRYHKAVIPPTSSRLKKFLGTRRIFPKPNRFPQRCNQPWVDTHVDYRGRVTPCCFSHRVLGDLNQQDFESIWNGRKYRWFRRRIQTLFPPPECRSCHMYEGINLGNPGNANLGEGMLLKCLYKTESILLRVWRRFFELEREEEDGPKFYLGKRWKPPKKEETQLDTSST